MYTFRSAYSIGKGTFDYHVESPEFNQKSLRICREPLLSKFLGICRVLQTHSFGLLGSNHFGLFHNASPHSEYDQLVDPPTSNDQEMLAQRFIDVAAYPLVMTHIAMKNHHV